MSEPNTTVALPATPNSVMSLEAMFLNLYLQALQQLPLAWLNRDKVNANHFNFQINFLLSLIPDKHLRASIEQEQIELVDYYKKKNDPYASERAGFIICSRIIDWLCIQFQLVNNDALGEVSEFQNDDLSIIPNKEDSDVADIPS